MTYQADIDREVAGSGRCEGGTMTDQGIGIIQDLRRIVATSDEPDEKVSAILRRLLSVPVNISASVAESDDVQNLFKRRLGVDEVEAVWRGALSALEFETSVVDAGVHDDPTSPEDYRKMWLNSVARGGLAHRYLTDARKADGTALTEYPETVDPEICAVSDVEEISE